MKKKLVSLLLAAAMALTVMTGCSSKMDGSEVVAEVGDEKITLDVANFYARYQQAQYETYYASFLGEDMWSGDAATGMDYEENVKAGVMDSLQTLYVIRQHAQDYDVELTEEDKDAIADAASDFLGGNDLDAKEAVTATEESVKEFLSLLTYQNKMYPLMIADVDTEVSDEEAAQKAMQYVEFSYTTTDDEGNSVELTEEEKEALQTEAQAFADGVKTAEDFAAYAEEKGYTVSTGTFDSESTVPSADVVAAADVMEEGQISGVVTSENGCYVVQLTSLLDREATDAKKQTIVSERQEELYASLCKEWLEEAGTKVHDSVWKKVSFERVGVTIKSSEEE